MAEARKRLYRGKVYYDVASTARLFRTTAMRIQHLMGTGELDWTQSRVGGKLLVSAESIVRYKRRALGKR